ncbi:MAG: precorrin-8X methylmutase, partial [Pseudomonadota bacterium]
MSIVRSGDVQYERDPAAITAKSFAIIRSEADFSRFGDNSPVAERVVHAAGDLAILEKLVISGAIVAATKAALSAGAMVVTDSEMARHAVSRRAVPSERVLCRLNDPGTPEQAKLAGTTRSAIAIRRAADALDGGIAVIGNAPTSLFTLFELMREGIAPAAIFAFPVGFVGAAESKAALVALSPPMPFVTLSGRRGGSAMAGAAF